MTKQKFAAVLVFLILVTLFTTVTVSAQDDENLVWAAIPCEAWASMGHEGPPWCRGESKSALIGNWKNAQNCVVSVQRYSWFTATPSNDGYSFLSSVTWRQPAGFVGECYYNYQITSELVAAYRLTGSAECGSFTNTVYCGGYTTSTGGVDVYTLGQLNGAVPYSASDYVFENRTIWLFFGRAIFISFAAKT